MVDVDLVLPPVHERARPEWFDRAKCLGVNAFDTGNLFYADHQHNGQVQEAKAVCLGTHPDHPGACPVLTECLEYALANGEKWGVWGGSSERERRRIKRQRRREDALATGKIIAISQAAADRSQPAGVAGNVQARDPAPWGHSKALVAAVLRRRAQERCTASLPGLPQRLVPAS
jgi:WhiB family redox-sensing transcriptional regulator